MIHSVDIHVNTFFRKNVLMTPTLPIADRWPMGGGLTFEQTAAHRVYENKELRRRILSGKVASSLQILDSQTSASGSSP
jgi:hypothetical protein